MTQSQSVVSLSRVQDPEQLSAMIQAGCHIHEIEAVCGYLKIRLRDLFPKTLEDFAGEGVSLEVQEIRFQHYERKRQFRLRKIVDEVGMGQGMTGDVRNKSQDVSKLKRLYTDYTPTGPSGRYATHSVSPSRLDDLPPSPRDQSELSSSEVSTQDRQKNTRDRRMQIHERSLQIRLAEIAAKITKLEAKEARHEQVKEELKVAEAEKQRKRELHSSKIRENLIKKYKELEAFEKREARKGLQLAQEPKSVPSRASIHPVVSRKNLMDENEEEEVQRQMMYIQSKLNCSAERAYQRRNLKALSLAAKLDQYRRAKDKVRATELSKEQEMLQLALKLKEQQDRSQRLRNEHIHAILQKTAEANKQKQTKHEELKRRHVTERVEQSRNEKGREEMKQKQDFIRQEKANLKKLDVVENLSRERDSLQEMKESILWKHKALASSAERRFQERSSQHQLLLREDFQRQEQLEKMRNSVESKMQDLHSRFLRTIDA